MGTKGGVSTPAWLLRALMLAFDMSVSYAAVAAFHLVHPEYFKMEKVGACVICMYMYVYVYLYMCVHSCMYIYMYA